MEPMLDTYNDNSVLQATCQTVGNPMLADMAAAYAETRSEQELKLVQSQSTAARVGATPTVPMRTIISALRDRTATLQAECLLEIYPRTPGTG
jgi:cytochrome c551/c552